MRHRAVKIDKSWLISLYLILVAVSVANRMATIHQFPDCYIVDKRIAALHLDESLNSCLATSKSNATSIGCYYESSSKWNDQLIVLDNTLLGRLSKRGQKQFTTETHQWDSRSNDYFGSLDSAIWTRPDAMLVEAREHWRISRDRVLIVHREAVWKGFYHS